MKTYIILIALLTGACAPDDLPAHLTAYTEPLLKPMVDDYMDFVAATRLNPKHAVDEIRYGEPGELDKIVKNAIGICLKGENGRVMIIEIGLSVELTKAVIYHEMGHCIFDLGHASSDGEIMSAAMETDPDYWSRNWSPLVQNYINDAKEL